MPEQSEALNLGKKRTSINNNSEEDEDGNEDVGDEEDEVVSLLAPSAAKRVKTERSSPPSISCCSEDEMISVQVASGNVDPMLTMNDVVRYGSDSRQCSPSSVDEDVVEMDINTSPSAGQYHNYCRRFWRNTGSVTRPLADKTYNFQYFCTVHDTLAAKC